MKRVRRIDLVESAGKVNTLVAARPHAAFTMVWVVGFFEEAVESVASDVATSTHTQVVRRVTSDLELALRDLAGRTTILTQDTGWSLIVVVPNLLDVLFLELFQRTDETHLEDGYLEHLVVELSEASSMLMYQGPLCPNPSQAPGAAPRTGLMS